MSERFTILTATAAALPLDNVDTDLIWPVGPGISLRKGDQAANAFATLRYDDSGAVRPDFVLNQAPWNEAKILVTGRNFGCGSSREMAVWSLREWGLRCIIAPGFADIFAGNAARNGLLLVELSESQVRDLVAIVALPETSRISVDLERRLVMAGRFEARFEIDAHRRECLLQGLDEIGSTLRSLPGIAAFGERYAREHPWTVPTGDG